MRKLNITRKKHLEMVLQQIPSHRSPKVHLEQYTTPADIAADVLWNAYSMGDINDTKLLTLAAALESLQLELPYLEQEKLLGLTLTQMQWRPRGCRHPK